MGLETGAYVGDLNVANPAGADPKSQGDDHIRLIKAAARNSFPGFAGVVAGTGVESGSGDAYVVALSPAPAAYAAGMLVVFKATHANAGAATLQVGALSSKALKAVDGSALEAGDIETGAVVGAFYDGTDFLLVTANDRVARGGDTMSGTHDFTGATVRVATPGAGDNSAKAASTAYVDAADALKADLSSPALTGAPTAPTAAPGTNTTQVATTAFVQQQAFQAALPMQAGNGGRVLSTDGTVASWTVAPIAPDVIVQDQKPSGTAGASLGNGVWVTRQLNTVVRNNGSVASVAGNSVTLPAGTWILRARLSATISCFSGALKSVRHRIYDVTGSAVLAQSGQVSSRMSAEGVDGQLFVGSEAEVVAVASFADSSAIRLESYADSNGSAGGALSSGQVEVYATFEATRVL
jgi:hypothetical protein